MKQTQLLAYAPDMAKMLWHLELCLLEMHSYKDDVHMLYRMADAAKPLAQGIDGLLSVAGYMPPPLEE